MTASLISQAFKKCKEEGRPALLTYTVAGDPTKKISLDILKSISKNIDIIEKKQQGISEIIILKKISCSSK